MPAAEGLHALTATELLAGYREGRFTPRQALQAVLARARTRGRDLGAFASLCDDDLPLPDAGGPLAGVPVSLKDDLCAAGLPATGGSHAFAQHRPERDSAAVARLRAAGALLFGKTNLSELAMTAEVASPLHGPMRNPWDPTRSAGASSGGAAAAVAAGIGPIAIATDSGGSVRYPAALCGVIGFAPSPGQVPRADDLPSNRSLCTIGVLARSTADVALALQALAPQTPVGRPVRELRVGWLGSSGDGPCVAPVRAALDRMAAGLGWHVQPFAWPVAPDPADVQAISDHERHAALRAWQVDPALLGPLARARLEAAARVSDARYGQALQARQRFVASLADVFSRVDLLAQASSPTVAPQLGEALGPAAQALHRLAWTNYGGCCAASVPVGHADGLPIGLHLAAAPGTDALLLAACAALEGLQSGRPMAINLVCR